MSTFRAYVRLMRAPNAFTAMADIFAGYFVVSSLDWQPTPLLWLVVSSALLYTGGVVLNDYCDYEKDKAERPDRPLPSGAIARRNALILAILLLLAGVCAAAAVGYISMMASIIIVFTVVSYDALMKNVPAVGSMYMGACRFFNLVLGMSVASELIVAKIAPAFLLFVYVISITTLGKGEGRGGKSGEANLALAGLICVVLGGCYLVYSGFFAHPLAICFLAVFAAATIPVVAKVRAQSDPASIQNAVKVLVLSIILLDSFFVAGAANLLYGLYVLGLMIPAILLARVVRVS